MVFTRDEFNLLTRLNIDKLKSTERTTIVTPLCASDFLSFMYTLYPKEGLKNSSVRILSLSQVSVPRIIRGCGVVENITWHNVHN